MANGGRGWFQRRKPERTPVEPATDPEVHEPTRIELYEARERARGSAPGSEPDFDALLRPIGSGEVSREAERRPATRSADGRAAPVGAAGDPTAPEVERAAGARSGPEVERASVTVGPRQPNVADAQQSSTTTQPTSEPEHRTEARGIASATAQQSSETRSARFDWDAATAAALTEDEASEPGPSNEKSLPRRNADELLEDIIREIVGDATAETVSSLHRTAADEPLAHVDPVIAPERKAVESTPATVPADGPSPNGVASLPDAAEGIHSPYAVPADPGAPSPVSRPDAGPGGTEQSTQTLPREPGDLAHDPGTEAPVSRETSMTHGGTPWLISSPTKPVVGPSSMRPSSRCPLRRASSRSRTRRAASARPPPR
ncbi:hypothetical protein GCM10025870_18520 [Agromyces marinus]|uniref:Uncharacterized protein n=1 Tax=Agromyces marinus TaxID=1389020 RepID=A0ABM8H1W8_9MICO|nr:hypothetical protein GCM10025870_18520 [Agromyces marinus]